MKYYQSKNGIVATPVNVDGNVRELQICLTHNGRPVLESARDQIHYAAVYAQWFPGNGSLLNPGRMDILVNVNCVKYLNSLGDDVVRTQNLVLMTRFSDEEKWRVAHDGVFHELLYTVVDGTCVDLWINGSPGQLDKTIPNFELYLNSTPVSDWSLSSVQYVRGYLACAWVHKDGVSVATSCDYVPESFLLAPGPLLDQNALNGVRALSEGIKNKVVSDRVTIVHVAKDFTTVPRLQDSSTHWRHNGKSEVLPIGLTLAGCDDFSFDLPF